VRYRAVNSTRTLVGIAAVAVAFTALVYVGAQPGPPLPVPSLSATIGMNGSSTLRGERDGEFAEDLDAVRDSGAGRLRLDVDWSSVEPTPGQQDWSSIDRVVDAARARGLTVLGIVTYTPRWAQDPSVPDGTTHGRPSSATDYGTFAGQAAEHFAGRISDWELWNEPNLVGFFAPQVDAGFYTAMVRAGYTAIHRVQPEATVLAGALSPNTGNAAPAAFLRQMYAAGVSGFLDAVSVHPYSYPASPSGTQRYNAFYQLHEVHQVMADNGDSAVRIWLTEFGAPTGGAKAVSEQRQAAIIAEGFILARSLSYLGPVFIYELRDADTGSGDIEDNFGLLRTDGTQKPAYAVVVRQAVTDAAHAGR